MHLESGSIQQQQQQQQQQIHPGLQGDHSTALLSSPLPLSLSLLTGTDMADGVHEERYGWFCTFQRLEIWALCASDGYEGDGDLRRNLQVQLFGKREVSYVMCVFLRCVCSINDTVCLPLPGRLFRVSEELHPHRSVYISWQANISNIILSNYEKYHHFSWNNDIFSRTDN